MKVKIGYKIYDSTEQPIMLILSDSDKENIKNMLPDAEKFCTFPDDEEYTEGMIKKFMKIE